MNNIRVKIKENSFCILNEYPLFIIMCHSLISEEQNQRSNALQLMQLLEIYLFHLNISPAKIFKRIFFLMDKWSLLVMSL